MIDQLKRDGATITPNDEVPPIVLADEYTAKRVFHWMQEAYRMGRNDKAAEISISLNYEPHSKGA